MGTRMMLPVAGALILLLQGSQPFPAKAVRLVEPLGAGGGVDTIVGTIAETVAGRTAYLVAPIPLAISDIRAGRLRALGVTTRKRSSLLPDVPSLAETGIIGFDYAIWYGVWAPVGTSDGVVDKLTEDIARALAMPDLRASLAEHGAEPMIMSRHEFARFVVAESESAGRIVKAR